MRGSGMNRFIFAVGLALGAAPAVADSGNRDSGQIGEPAGSGLYPAIAETLMNAPGYTVYRPLELPSHPLPVVVWGNGGCRDNGLSASHFLREIASHGYLVIANGSAREERPPRATREPSPPPRSPAPPPPTRVADETS